MFPRSYTTKTLLPPLARETAIVEYSASMPGESTSSVDQVDGLPSTARLARRRARAAWAEVAHHLWAMHEAPFILPLKLAVSIA